VNRCISISPTDDIRCAHAMDHRGLHFAMRDGVQYTWGFEAPVNRLNPWSAMVREFHLAADQPVEERPIHLYTKLAFGGPAHEQLRSLRKRLLEEEFNEYLAAERDGSMVGVADGLADMLYIILGTCHAYGIPIERVFAEVHRSNMTKVDPATGKVRRREDGKILKPEGYSPPDIVSAVYGKA
jgi:predicted HAD superfamily Cof-like phosphohydrolase